LIVVFIEADAIPY